MSVERNVLATGVVDGNIYAIGGALTAFASTSVVEAYDTTTNSWTFKTDLPQELCGITACTVNNKIYVIGGASSIYGSGFVVDSVYEYDPLLDSWTRKSNIPIPIGMAVAAVVNEKIYIIGGAPFGWNTAYKTVYEYNPATDIWTQKSDMPTARYLSSATEVDGKIYVFGGTPNISLTPLSNVEAYDPVTDTWTTKSSMPTARWGLTVSAINGKIYAISGAASPSSISGAVEEYNPVLNTWTIKTSIPTPRWGLSACSIGGEILTIGGQLITNIRVSTVEEYDPALDTITVSVENINYSILTSFELEQNYPNPFNPNTKIKYQIPELSFINIKVYDVLGNEVAILVNEVKPAGEYEVVFYSNSDEGQNLSSGVYFYQLRIKGPEINSGQGIIHTKKMLLLK